MIRAAVAPAVACLLLLPASRLEAPVAPHPTSPRMEAPPVFKGGSPVPPKTLPPAATCATADVRNHQVPGQVNGELVAGASGLRALRGAWGDARIFVHGGTFDGADLRGAKLHNICFVGTSFRGSDWRGAEAAGIGFFWSDLTGSNLAGARMANVTFDGPHLERVNAQGANFSGGRVSGNDFGGWEGLRLASANLRGFRFRCLPIGGESCGRWGTVSFRGADLRGAHLNGFLGDADWTGAQLGDTRVALTQLLDLGGARLTGPLLVSERPAEVRLSPAEYAWLRGRIGKRQEVLPAEAGARKVRKPAPWMRPGAEALFVAPRIRFDAEAQASPLYRRLMPAIVAGAISYLRVKVGPGGRVEAVGSAIGGNGHMCGLGAKNLRLSADGWHSGWAEPFEPPAPPPAAPVPVLRFHADRAEVYENGHPRDETLLRNGFDRFASCGARAGFEEMIRVPFPPHRAHELWYAAGMDAG